MFPIQFVIADADVLTVALYIFLFIFFFALGIKVSGMFCFVAGIVMFFLALEVFTLTSSAPLAILIFFLGIVTMLIGFTQPFELGGKA